MKKSYYIKYRLVLKTSSGKKEFPDKEIIIRNRENDLLAKLSLQGYLTKKYGENFVSSQIISCELWVDNPLEDLLFGKFHY